MEQFSNGCKRSLSLLIAVSFALVMLCGSTWAAQDIDASEGDFREFGSDGPVVYDLSNSPLWSWTVTSGEIYVSFGGGKSLTNGATGYFNYSDIPEQVTLATTNGASGSARWTLSTADGTILRLSVKLDTPIPAGTSVLFNGTVYCALTGGWANSSRLGYIYPRQFALYAGSAQVIRRSEDDLDGYFSISSFTKYFSSAVYEFTYEFTFPDGYISATAPSLAYVYPGYAFLLFQDSVYPSYENSDPVPFLLQQILDALQSGGSGSPDVVTAVNNASTAITGAVNNASTTISNAVNNVTTTVTNIFQSTQEQVDAAKEVTDQISDKASDIKDASEQIAAGTPKPDAPELAQANNPMEWIQRTDAAYMSGVDSFQQILSDQLFLTMLMLVAGFALCAYVLYGKRA